MRYQLSRRDLLLATRAGAASIALAEMGVPARAEDGFAISIVGGTWGQGQIRTYITETDFEKKNNVKISCGPLGLRLGCDRSSVFRSTLPEQERGGARPPL